MVKEKIMPSDLPNDLLEVFRAFSEMIRQRRESAKQETVSRALAFESDLAGIELLFRQELLNSVRSSIYKRTKARPKSVQKFESLIGSRLEDYVSEYIRYYNLEKTFTNFRKTGKVDTSLLLRSSGSSVRLFGKSEVESAFKSAVDIYLAGKYEQGMQSSRLTKKKDRPQELQNATREKRKYSKRARPDDVSIRRGLVKAFVAANPNMKGRSLDLHTCQHLDSFRVPIREQWEDEYGISSWKEGYTDSKVKELIHKMFSTDRKKLL